MERMTSVVGAAVLSLACCSSGGASNDGQAVAADSGTAIAGFRAPDVCTPETDQYTEYGDRVCCGRDSEIPEVSCVDLSKDGGVFGMYGGCRPEGAVYDRKFAGGVCCSGLVSARVLVEASPDISHPGLPPGCEIGAPGGIAVCVACPDERCGLGETPCNCPEDCPRQ
jgi:hypothetical protein